MIGSLRILPSQAMAIALLFVPFASASAQDVQDEFRQGVDLLSRGQKEEALASFQRVLALDPSHEDAYLLWQSTDHDVWLDMLVMEGEFELVAKRMMELARMGRKERTNDPDAIRELLSGLDSEDVVQRTRVVRQLAANHGEYAVPMMLYALGDAGDADRRVVFMQSLTKMGADVVPPLTEGLDSDNPYLRRNVALTLGYIGDPRANGVLAKHAAMDEDEGVRSAASQALDQTGGTADGLGQLLALGDAYHRQDDSVLAPHQFSDVVWSWVGQELVPSAVPRFLYAEEMAKKAYYRALEVAPESTEALAGIARASVAQKVKLSEWESLGQDVGDWGERLAGDDLAVQLAGSSALELALDWSLDNDDQTAATGLARALGAAASSSSSALQRAVSGQGGAVRGEAAVALGRIASRNGQSPSSDVVQALAESAAREVVRIGAVIDADDARRNALEQALASEGVLVNAWASGGRGLASLRAIPGIDVLLVADQLPDLTTDQVLDEFGSDPRFQDTPVFVITSDAEGTGELYAERSAGTIGSAADLEAVREAMAGGMNRDREEANRLAAEAASALAALAASGADVSSAADALASTVGSRNDDIVVPALQALSQVGGPAAVDAIAALISDADRSEAARLAAADALAGIFSRYSSAEASVVELLEGVVGDATAPFEIRAGASNALGRVSLDAETRRRLMNAARTSSAAE